MKSNLYKIIVHVLFLFVFILIFFNIFRRAFSGSFIGFNGLLEMFQNTSNFSVNINISDFTISGDWGLFDAFRQFLNVFTSAFGIIVWLGSNLLNLVLFLAQFVGFLFV